MYAEHLWQVRRGADRFELADIPTLTCLEFSPPRLEDLATPWSGALLGRTEQKATASAQELRLVISAVTKPPGPAPCGLISALTASPRRTPGARVHHAPSAPADHRPQTSWCCIRGGAPRTAGPVHAVFPPVQRALRTVTKGACDVLPPGHVSKRGFFGTDGLRIFFTGGGFETLVRELTTRCAEGTLVEA